MQLCPCRTYSSRLPVTSFLVAASCLSLPPPLTLGKNRPKSNLQHKITGVIQVLDQLLRLPPPWGSSDQTVATQRIGQDIIIADYIACFINNVLLLLFFFFFIKQYITKQSSTISRHNGFQIYRMNSLKDKKWKNTTGPLITERKLSWR